ncbi:MAG TPA: histidine kinase dimerization/phospho-acceptor domain-containing protein, partial [Candidatus Limnocylindrales bacterium]|nr:histidine kinase dimerization/phospho-acceptor domain-containing protein [Candidatus Limnocylindrales bacterium]
MTSPDDASLVGSMTAQPATHPERSPYRQNEAAHVVADRPVVRDVLASIVESSPAAVAVFRRDASVGYRNRAWLRLVGADAPAIGGAPDPIALALEQGRASPSEERTIGRADGTQARVLLSVVPIIDHSGRSIGAIAQGESLDRAAAGTLREAFLGVLSHELRTPITSIYGGSQLLLNEDLSAES